MALINCPECSKEFSDKAPACPNCGYGLTLEDKIALHCDIDWQAVLVQGENSKNMAEKKRLYTLISEHCPDDVLAGEAYNYMGVNCFNQKDYQEAMRYYKLAFEKGNCNAAGNIGVLYHDGLGVEQNNKLALHWNEQAIALGNKSVGILRRVGVESDELNLYDKAFNYYTAASELGDDTANNNLGMMYYNGKGVNRDLQLAIKYFRAAALSGDDVAKANLEFALQKLEEEKTAQQISRHSLSSEEIEEIADAPTVTNRAAKIIACLVCSAICIGLFIGAFSADNPGVTMLFAGIFLVAAAGFGVAIFSKNEKVSTAKRIAAASGTAFTPTCTVALEGGEFAIDVNRKLWFYRNPAKLRSTNSVIEATITPLYEDKDNTLKRAVVGGVLAGGAGALIGAATSSSKQKLSIFSDLTIKTTEPDFGTQTFRIHSVVAQSVVDAVKQAKRL
ncbi:MAG: sel1 repeat family protein [Fibromonadales bacterium]|nr:sel1 repeat family protein [Fibromonadales bacterium]